MPPNAGGAKVSDDLLGFAMIVAALLFYELPWIVAFLRGNKHCWRIAIVDLLTGWTVVGWVACMVWAFAKQRRKA